jgi:hypothetical protein
MAALAAIDAPAGFSKSGYAGKMAAIHRKSRHAKYFPR